MVPRGHRTRNRFSVKRVDTVGHKRAENATLEENREGAAAAGSGDRSDPGLCWSHARDRSVVSPESSRVGGLSYPASDVRAHGGAFQPARSTSSILHFFFLLMIAAGCVMLICAYPPSVVVNALIIDVSR